MKHWSEETKRKPLRAAVEKLKRRVERAYWLADEDRADQAHDDLLSAEWRLRRAERNSSE